MLIFLSFVPSKKYLYILEQIFMTLKITDACLQKEMAIHAKTYVILYEKMFLIYKKC
jgi:hypothetical protein